MHSFARREFLGMSLGGLAALGSGPLLAKDKDKDKDKKKKSPDTKTPAGPFDTLFLTWQRDPTTTMTVQWIGPATHSTRSSIQCSSQKPGPAVTAPIQQRDYHPMSDLRVHRAELTGLTPGTEYQFRIGDHLTTHRFRTMPAKATDSFQFVSGGDCGANSHVIANNILAAKQNPMFALIGGDLAYDNGHSIDANLAFMRNYSRHMVDGEGRLIPMVSCIGNHEVKGGYLAQREDGPLFFSLHDGLFRERSYGTLDFGNYLSLVLLDTGHVAPIEGEQTSWLNKTLIERAGLPHLIVANHVPAYPSYRKAEQDEEGKLGTGEGNRAHWVPLFEKHNVDVVLEHHDHTFKRTHPLKDGRIDANGVTYLGDGSWGKLRAPKAAEDRPYLAATSGSYHMTLHRLEGEQQFHLALEETGRIVDICATHKRQRRAMGRGRT